MRILVTGSSGFVGAAVVQRLASSHTVVGLSRRASPNAHESVQHDVSVPSIDGLVDAVVPCDVIVHAASLIDMQPYNPAVVTTNALGAQNIAALAERWNAHVVYISSIQVIGTPLVLPITETHPTAPRTTYHATKLFGEHLLAPYGCALRLTAPIGSDMPRNRILPVFAARAAAGEPLRLAGQGGRRQDYVHVDDAADAIAACIEQRPTGVYNLGAGVSLSNLELARLIIDTLDSTSAIEFTGAPDAEEHLHWDVSIDKARETFGYAPRGDLRAVINALAGRTPAK